MSLNIAEKLEEREIMMHGMKCVEDVIPGGAEIKNPGTRPMHDTRI
jgi:hypothetical protein